MSDQRSGCRFGRAFLPLIALSLTVLLATPPLAAQGTPPSNKPPSKKRLVCWTDEAGNRSCGDAVPARYAGTEKQVLDQTGRTVKIIPGALTPEQRAAQAVQLQQEAEAKRMGDQQAAYDRALTATYSTPQDLVALRNDRLATVDSTLEIREAAARRDSVTLAELRKRLPEAGSKAKPDPAVVKSISQYETSLAENQTAIADLIRSREGICSSFTRDIQRFQELKSGNVTFDSPCPAGGSLHRPKEKLDLAAARHFFDRWVELERDFDPQLLTLYAEEGVVKIRSLGPDGKPSDTQVTMAEHRKELVKTLPLAKEKLDTPTYADLSITDEGNGSVKVSGTRASRLAKVPEPFYLLLRPSGQSWRITEAYTERRAAAP